jgi:hypothetical protein
VFYFGEKVISFKSLQETDAIAVGYSDIKH